MKKREGDKDMMEVGQQRIKNGRVAPLSTLLPRIQEISLRSGGFEAQILELLKDNMLRLATKTVIFTVFLLNFIMTKKPSYTTTHVRVTPLSTFLRTYVAQEVDSGVTPWWVVG